MPRTAELAIESLAYDKGPADLSATEALLPPRVRQFKRIYKDLIQRDVSDQIYALLGSLTHKILEGTAQTMAAKNQTHTLEALASTLEDFSKERIETEQLIPELQKRIWAAVKKTVWVDHEVAVEERLFATLDDYVISGQPDLYFKRAKHFDDYKLCSVYNHIFGIKKEWEEQQNIYRWLLYKNGKEAETATIHAIYRDWTKSKARRDPSYPPDQWMTYDVTLWPVEQIETWLSQRIAAHRAAEAAEDPEDIPLCTAEERWKSGEAYAVTKKTRTRAIKLFDSEAEAKVWIQKWEKPGEKLLIEYRPGEDRRCIGNYCEVAEFCSHGKRLRDIAGSD